MISNGEAPDTDYQRCLKRYNAIREDVVSKHAGKWIVFKGEFNENDEPMFSIYTNKPWRDRFTFILQIGYEDKSNVSDKVKNISLGNKLDYLSKIINSIKEIQNEIDRKQSTLQSQIIQLECTYEEIREIENKST